MSIAKCPRFRSTTRPQSTRIPGWTKTVLTRQLCNPKNDQQNLQGGNSEMTFECEHPGVLDFNTPHSNSQTPSPMLSPAVDPSIPYGCYIYGLSRHSRSHSALDPLVRSPNLITHDEQTLSPVFNGVSSFLVLLEAHRSKMCTYSPPSAMVDVGNHSLSMLVFKTGERQRKTRKTTQKKKTLLRTFAFLRLPSFYLRMVNFPE